MNETDWTNQEIEESISIEKLKKDFEELKGKSTVDSKKLLIILQKFLNILKKIAIIENYSLQSNLNGDLIVSNKTLFLELMTFGGQLVYEIRSLLLQEDIDYLLGGWDSEHQTLKQSKKSQSEILANMTASLSNGAIMLNKELENTDRLDKVAKHINDLWVQMKKLSDYESFDYTTVIPINVPYTYYNKYTEKNEISTRKFYPKPEADTQVYMRWQDGRTKAKRYGYYKMGNYYSFFNDGWLYEWFSTYIHQNSYNKLRKALFEHHSLSVMMQKQDNVAGYKGGDFVTNKQGLTKQQFQAKFQNLKIISFDSIVKVLTKLQENLELYNSAEKEKQNEAIVQLVNLFVNQNNKQINDSAAKTAFKKMNKILKIE